MPTLCCCFLRTGSPKVTGLTCITCGHRQRQTPAVIAFPTTCGKRGGWWSGSLYENHKLSLRHYHETSTRPGVDQANTAQSTNITCDTCPTQESTLSTFLEHDNRVSPVNIYFEVCKAHRSAGAIRRPLRLLRIIK